MSGLQSGALHAHPVGPQGEDLAPDTDLLRRAEELMQELDLLHSEADKIKSTIASSRVILAEYERQIESASAALASIAESTYCELESGYYRLKVRWVKGRQSVSWDAEKLAGLLTPDLGKLTLTEVTTWQADGVLLNALAESGKLPEQAYEARTVKPGVNRFKVERLK